MAAVSNTLKQVSNESNGGEREKVDEGKMRTEAESSREPTDTPVCPFFVQTRSGRGQHENILPECAERLALSIEEMVEEKKKNKRKTFFVCRVGRYERTRARICRFALISVSPSFRDA